MEKKFGPCWISLDVLVINTIVLLDRIIKIISFAFPFGRSWPKAARALHNAVSDLGVKQTFVWVFVSIWLEDHR